MTGKAYTQIDQFTTHSISTFSPSYLILTSTLQLVCQLFPSDISMLTAICNFTFETCLLTTCIREDL